MKKIINNQKEEKLFKNKSFQNIKNSLKRIKEIELNKNSIDIIHKEKSEPNIKDNTYLKKIKNPKIKNTLPNNNFNQKKKLINNNNTFLPIYLSSIANKKNYIETINKIKNKYNLEKSKNKFNKTFYNNSNIDNHKYSNYTIYLQNELPFNKKYDFNFPKSKDYDNIMPNIKYNINPKFTSDKKMKPLNIFYPSNKSLNSKEYMAIHQSNKILQYKTNIKNDNSDIKPNDIEDNNKKIKKKQFNSISLSKKQLQNILKTKIEPYTEHKDELITNDSLKKIKNINLNNSNTDKIEQLNFVIPKIINNHSIIIEKKETSKNYINSSINIPKTTKKDNNYNYFSKSISFDYFSRNNIIKTKNGRTFTNNIYNIYDNSNKSLIYFDNNKPENSINNNLNEYISRNKNNIKEKSLRKNKVRFLNITPIKKEKNISDNNISFLTKINNININTYKQKNIYYIKIIKKNKISLLINNKNNEDKFISKENEKLKTYNSSDNNNNLYLFKKDYIQSNYQKKKKYKDYYFELKHFSMLKIFSYLNINSINKSFLNKNIINYLTLNYSFSSIYMPLIDLTRKRSSLFMKGKLFLIQKNPIIFEDKKSKFIEIKRKKKFENVSLNFIYRELFSNNINSKCINYLDKEEYIYKSNKEKKTFLNNSISYKNDNEFISKKSQKKLSISFFNKYNKSKKNKKSIYNLSILQKGNFFNLKKENKNEENLKIKKFEKRTAVNNNNIFKRFPKKNSYFNLIDNFNIIEKYKILKNLIKEGKELLFIDYFNHNSKIIDKNYKDEDGNTFLILSIKYNMNNISKMLINKGININIQNNDGNSALHFALSSKNFYMADILRKFGALENSINNLGYTPWECIGKNIENDPIY